jgi:4'-phosphopantetheinyl transferase EntD
MPLIFETQTETAKKIGVWEITEPESFFLESIGAEVDHTISKKRFLEKICSAHLLNLLTGENFYNFLTNDANGKPLILNSSYSVSFSHSKNMVACIVDKKGSALGIDIEEIRERILNMKHKFISPNDSSPLEGVEHAHLIWGAKEVLYKIYSKKELDFNTHLRVDYQDDITGYIHKLPHESSHVMDYIILNNFMLVWNI